MNIKEFVQNTVRRALALYESTRPAPTLAVTSKTLWSGKVAGTQGTTISLSENDTNYDVVEVFGYIKFSDNAGETPMLLLTYYTENITEGALLSFIGVSQTTTSPAIGEGVLARTNNRTLTSVAQSNSRFTFTRVIGRKYVQST